MKCRRCGCSEFNPCLNQWGEACAWAAPELCTFCVTDREFEIAELLVQYALAHDSAADIRRRKYTPAQHVHALRLYQAATGATA